MTTETNTAAGAVAAGPRYFSSLVLGETHVSAGRTVTEADIVLFAGLSGDSNPLHTDEEWVRANTSYRGRIAHGLLVLAMSSGLRTPGLDRLHILGFLNAERKMAAPTYPGDTIHTRQTITELRPSRSRPGAGVVTIEVETVKNDGTVVQSGTDVLLVGGDDER